MAGNWGSCLRRRGGIWWFRRRVPKHLTERLSTVEINRSLKTTCSREAGRGARRCWLATEELFKAVAYQPTLSEEQVALLIRRLVDEPLFESQTADAIINDFVTGSGSLLRTLHHRDDLPAAWKGLSPDARQHVQLHIDRIADRIEVSVARLGQESAETRSVVAGFRAWKAGRNAGLAIAETERTALTRAVEAVGTATTEGRTIVWEAAPHPVEQDSLRPVDLPATFLPSTSARRSKREPLSTKRRTIAEFYPRFIASKQEVVEDQEGYTEHTVTQSEATFQLWLDIHGDTPIAEIDGEMAGSFRDILLKLPSSHGKSGTKGGTAQRATVTQEINRADKKQNAIDERNALLQPGAVREPAVSRLKLKTVKRHFSTLSQFWAWMQQRQIVPRGSDLNPFRGWEYKGLKRGQKTRLPWSIADLNMLLGSPWMQGDAHGTSPWWMTLIAMLTGMRIEEIARLRPLYDIETIDGVPCIVVQEHPHPERWSPKTEAGERVIPIPTMLLEKGFMDLVGHRIREKSYRLFPDLPKQGNKLSKSVSRDFSRNKIALGIGPKVVFHSFRHNVETILQNAPPSNVRTSWIDAILGHAADDTEDDNGRRVAVSEGAKTYLHAIGLQNLQSTVAEIVYPAEVRFDLIRRPPDA